MLDAIWAHGPLTGLLNEAAANFVAPTMDLTPRGFEAVTSTVMNGTFFCTHPLGKRWIAEGRPGSKVEAEAIAACRPARTGIVAAAE